jgi:hypothetical protein
MGQPEPVVLSIEAAAAAAVGEFFDSTAPVLIPARAWAALYFDGDYGAAGQAAAFRFSRVRWITIGDDAANCGITDYEAGNPVFGTAGMLYTFALDRLQAGHRARIYCDRSSAARAIRGLGRLWNDVEWWISTLDGIPATRQQLAADLAENYDAPIGPQKLWANQVWGGPRASVDKSLLYGTW